MSKILVEQAIKNLEKIINDHEYNCDVHVENLGEMKEISFYINESMEDGEPIATITIVPMQGL